jgi:PAS domain-containing protein
MNAAAWSITEDIAPMLGFTAALIAVLLIPVRRGGTFSRAAKLFFVASIMCYFISSISSILGHFNLVSAEVNSIMPLVELLWVPFILFGVYALYSSQQLHDSIAARHEVVRAGEMLESVMDTAPAGVVVLDAAGAITFANPEARRLLDMDEQPGSDGESLTWSVHVGDDSGLDSRQGARGDFKGLLDAEPMRNASVTVSWPNGWRRSLQVNTTPLRDAETSDVTGAVVAFVEREPWIPSVRAVGAHGLR